MLPGDQSLGIAAEFNILARLPKYSSNMTFSGFFSSATYVFLKCYETMKNKCSLCYMCSTANGCVCVGGGGGGGFQRETWYVMEFPLLCTIWVNFHLHPLYVKIYSLVYILLCDVVHGVRGINTYIHV